VKQCDANIEERVKSVIVSQLKPDLHSVTLTREMPILGRELGFDSVALFELVAALEKELDICFDQSDVGIEVFENIGTLVNHIETKCLSL